MSDTGNITGRFAATGEDSGFVDVGSGHHLHYKRLGKRGGVPVIVLHGGPGGQMIPDMGIYDPDVYDVVFFSQRGCGSSWRDGDPERPENAMPDETLSYYLRKIENQSGENTIPDLVEDVEAIRHHFWPDKKVNISGGSWGGALGMLYAIYYPSHVDRLLLRATSLIELCGSMNPADEEATQRQLQQNIHFQKFYDKMAELEETSFPLNEIMERLYYGLHDLREREWTDQQKWDAAKAWRHWNQDLSFKGGASDAVHDAVDRDMERTIKIASLFSYFSEVEYPKFGAQFLEQNLPSLEGQCRIDFVHGVGDDICPIENAVSASSWVSGEMCLPERLLSSGFWVSSDKSVRVFAAETGHSAEDRGMARVLGAVLRDWAGDDSGLCELYPPVRIENPVVRADQGRELSTPLLPAGVCPA